MNTQPYSYQVIGARRIKRYGGRALLADEQGLGKSLEYLMFLERNPELCPAVVVCPASLKYNWEDEAAKHFNLRAEVLEGTRPPKRLPLNPARLYVANYQILGKRNAENAGPGWNDYLKALRPQSVCLDECQAISNLTAKQTKWVRRLCDGVPSVVGLSGTPLTNRPKELFSILNLLRPDLFPSFKVYGDRYCAPRMTQWGMQYDGADHLDELHGILTEHLMIRRRKADVLHDLPPKRRYCVTLPLTDPGQYKKAQDSFLQWLGTVAPEKVFRAKRAQRLTQVGYLRRLLAQLKLPAVCEWVDNFLADTDSKLVLFCVHTETIDHLCRRYKSLCVRVDGSTPVRDRQRAKDAFQGNKGVRVFVGNIDAAGKGLTLTAADTVAFVELPWTPGAAVQAEDRIHRIGQTREADVVFLCGRGTIDGRVAELLQTKQGTLSGVLDGGAREEDLNVFDLLCRSLLTEKVTS
jgi:SWI/SNF-related matrix-associated actin-dependent regulator of chromatin subfamily A-like protein 1